jgi:hypothetical protein
MLALPPFLYALTAATVSKTTTMSNAPHVPTTTNPTTVHTSWLGFGAESWDVYLLVALGLATFAALLVVLSTYGSIVTHKREADAANRELERYKLTVEGKVADAKSAGIDAGRKAGAADLKAAEANERAAKATERTAELGKETEALRHENLLLQTRIAPRALSKEQFEALQSLEGRVATVGIMPQVGNDASLFASQLFSALNHAGVEVKWYFAPAGASWTGILLGLPHSGYAGRDKDPLIEAFKKADLYGGDLDLGNFGFPDVPKDIPLIMVGDKPLQFAKPPYFGPPAKAAPAPAK